MFMTLMSNKLYDRIKYLFCKPFRMEYGYDHNTWYSTSSPCLFQNGQTHGIKTSL